MRRFVFTIALAFSGLSTVAAHAHEPPFAWTGLYLGVNVGYSWGRATADVDVSTAERTRVFRAFGQPAQTLISDVTVSGPGGTASGSADVDGWLGGAHVGYNWQLQRWVYGVEADLQWTGQDGDVAACLGAACAKASYELDWFGTLRGRLGYLVQPRSLLYVTGGLAYGRVNADFSASAPSVPALSASDSATKAGWVIGGGLEWAVDRNWMLRAEYLYLDLGGMRSGIGSKTTQGIIQDAPQDCLTTVIDTRAGGTVRTDLTDQIFRLAVSYKFNEAYTPLK